MFAKLLQAEGLRSGSVYATGVMKAKDVIQMVADCRAQESIREMTDRIMRENNCLENEKAAGQGDLSVNLMRNNDYEQYNLYL